MTKTFVIKITINFINTNKILKIKVINIPGLGILLFLEKRSPVVWVCLKLTIWLRLIHFIFMDTFQKLKIKHILIIHI